MSVLEILAQVKAGKITEADAAALIGQQGGGKNGVSLTTGAKQGGKVRVNHAGAQIDLTGAQAVAILTHADAVRALLARYVGATARTEQADGRNGDTFSKHYLGDLLCGYKPEQVETVKAVGKSATGRKAS